MINRYERLNQELKMVETKRKVAAYCRVSTDNEDQANSFESQQRYFRQYIERSTTVGKRNLLSLKTITSRLSPVSYSMKQTAF